MLIKKLQYSFIWGSSKEIPIKSASLWIFINILPDKEVTELNIIFKVILELPVIYSKRSNRTDERFQALFEDQREISKPKDLLSLSYHKKKWTFHYPPHFTRVEQFPVSHYYNHEIKIIPPGFSWRPDRWIQIRQTSSLHWVAERYNYFIKIFRVSWITKNSIHLIKY